LDRAAAEDALAVAVRAPSIHNTQPWSWRLTTDGLVLRADRTRQLEVADPDGHSLVSCGAAAHLTEVSLRAIGWQVESTLLPDPSDPDALALFRVTGRDDPDDAAAAEVAAALRRRSDRRPFASSDVSPATTETLQAAASPTSVR
jgi:nitroreductase